MNKSGTPQIKDGSITEPKLSADLAAKVNAGGTGHTHTLSQVTDAGNSAGLNVGTGAGTVAAGDHAHAGVYVEPSGGVTLIKSGDYLYIRTAWTATHDLIQKIRLTVTPASATDSDPVNILAAGTVPVATADAAVPTTAYTVTLQNATDDAAPVNINDTYIGANHGCDGVRAVTVASHDKTDADVGSTWTDGAAVVFTLVRVVNATTLWFLSENTGTDGDWTWQKTVNGTTLTHAAGATHAGAITISSYASGSLEPAIKDQTRTVLVDGLVEAASDGVRVAGFVDVVHTYNIIDVPSLLAFLQAGVGTTPAPSYTDASVDDVARVTITYRFTENGACTVYQTFQALKALKVNYLGFVQAEKVERPAGGTWNEYVPKMASFAIGGNTYDLKAIQDITALADELALTSDRWASATAPPDRFVQLTKASGGANYYGMAVGYCPRAGVGVPSVRTAAVTTAGTIGTSKKTYPKAVVGGSTTYPTSLVPAGSSWDAVAFRCPINYANHPNATCAAWYYVGDDVYLMADYHVAVSEYIPLPARLTGRHIEIVESDGLTVGSDFVTQDGVHVTVAGTYGSAVLRLYTGQSPALGTASGLLKADGNGSVSAATANTDYLPVNAPAMTGAATAGSLAATGTVSGATATGTGVNAAIVGVASGNGVAVYGNAGTGGYGVRGDATTGYAVYGSAGTGYGVGAVSSSGTGLYATTKTGRGADINQSGTIAANITNNALHVTRVAASGSYAISGDLIFGNDAPTGTPTRTGNLIRLQKDGTDVFKVALSGLVSTAGGLLTSAAAPAAQTSAGTIGEIRTDATYLYRCTVSGTDGNAHWKRVALDDSAW